ncbi:hypothetical protein PCE1_002241 [Barthelona sp. PCE]
MTSLKSALSMLSDAYSFRETQQESARLMFNDALEIILAFTFLIDGKLYPHTKGAFQRHAFELIRILESSTLSGSVVTSENWFAHVGHELSDAQFNELFGLAISFDEKRSSEDAYQLYMFCLEVGLSHTNHLRNILHQVMTAYHPNAPDEVCLRNDIENRKKRMASILERAEELKKKINFKELPVKPLSDSELRVLLDSSTVGGIQYVPFNEADERITMTRFKESSFALSSSQRNSNVVWVNANDLPNAHMISSLSVQTPRQHLVPNCSFITAMTLGVQCERKTHLPIISGKIFPKTDSKRSVLSSKYSVKLFFNGCWRKVEVDSFLPMRQGAFGQLEHASAHSVVDGELWVSILEKAFIKLMGRSYDFPGSTVALDMFCLSRFIPEEVRIDDSSKSATFKRIVDGMLTQKAYVSGGSRPTADVDGLAPSHAYAILDYVEHGTVQLLKLKNPWLRQSYMGAYAPGSSAWTPELKRKVGYESWLQTFKNGIFFVTIDEFYQFFDVLTFSWLPNLFPFFNEIHFKVPNANRPDSRLNTYPQFTVTLPQRNGERAVWLLLNRHMRSLETKNDCYSTIHVYDTTSSAAIIANRIVGAIHMGKHFNGLLYLAKLVLPACVQRITVCPECSEQTTDEFFSLFVYSECNVVLSRAQ